MSPQSTIAVLLLAAASCASLAAHGQQVVARSSSSEDESSIADPEVVAGSQSRQMSSHKYLSPHKMMHFGKRLLIQQAPGIYNTANRVLDPYGRPAIEQAAEQQQQQQPELLPFSFYFPVPRDRLLESARTESFAARNGPVANRVEDLLSRQAMIGICDENSGATRHQAQLRRAGSQMPLKSMRLTKADEPARPMHLMKGDEPTAADSDAGSSAEPQPPAAKKQAEAAPAADGGQLEQRDATATTNGRPEGDEIDRSSRSVSRSLLPGLTRAQLSMLFGGQPGSSGSLLNFIKKAEPQRMTFMHFGRRR